MRSTSTAQLAKGKWPSILVQLGFDEAILTGKHTACPLCGGKDRFRFDNKEGRGTYFCNHCGSGDGIKLVAEHCCVTTGQAMAEIDKVAKTATETPISEARTIEDKVRALRKVWSGAKPVESGDPVALYIAARIGEFDAGEVSDIRHHPGVSYRHEDGTTTMHPAMLALVRGPIGTGLSIHRTYLTHDGRKAKVKEVKKLMSGRDIRGGAIRLSPMGSDGVLGVAEGVETALGCEQFFGIPTWSCVSANVLERFDPPSGVKKLVIYGDNDANGVGQHAAYGLMRRIHAKGIEVEVKLPPQVGTDWLDDYLAKR